jgi:alpha-L-rhamnosidase
VGFEYVTPFNSTLHEKILQLIKTLPLKRLKLFSLPVILATFCISCDNKNSSGIMPGDLKCEYRINPVGIDNNTPKLSWVLHSDSRSQIQTSYQILVSDSFEKLSENFGNEWDSHKVTSDQSIHLAYKGKPLKSGIRYYWKVRVWDREKNKSAWSEPAFWEMGLLETKDWRAKWIGFDCDLAAPLLRKEFNLRMDIKEARVYISGLGYYELSINGYKIGDHVLDPGQTDYEQRSFYVVYDVTNNIKKGANAIGVILGNGWYNQSVVNTEKYGWKDVIYGQPRLYFQMHIIYQDGSEDYVISDKSWKGFPGPIISNNVYAGEYYDARSEQKGWDTPGFDDNSWTIVKMLDGPGGKLVCQDLPPIKKMKTIKPVKITNPKPGVYVYDMGQNFAGWARLRVTGRRGSEIRLRFAEWLNNDGMIDPGSTGYYATGVVQTDKYICKGTDEEIWEPRFTYHGFQYVEMTGFPGTPTAANLEGIVVYSSLNKAGEFSCSDSIINRLHETALWTEVSNLYSIPTDCPHRERCGWLGDAFLTSDMVIYNFDAAVFWSKFIRDIETSRKGDVPTNIAPGKRFGGKDPDWGAAFIQLTWNMFLYYDDKSIIDEHYDGMTFFMDNLQKIAKGNIIYQGIGSLFAPGRIMPLETPKEFTSTVLYYFCSDVMSRMARITNRKQDAEKYASFALQIKSSFNNKFYNNVDKTYRGQEKNILALAFGLVGENDEKAVADNLNQEILIRNKGHISTGVFGSRYIYEILGKFGYGETVQNMFALKTFPGFGYMFSRGANTFWENWGEQTFEDRKVPGDERSKNHPFQAGFGAWFFNGIAGIKPDPENPGFKHIILQPEIIGDLTYAKTKYTSIYGVIKSDWQTHEGILKWNISVPANTSATIYIPTEKVEFVKESGDLAKSANGVKFLKTENGNAVYNIGSGEYEFTWNQ